MPKLCLGCMKQKHDSPVCEHCGYDENLQNLPHQLPVGTILQNQYLIGRVLGQGGFGITYLGWDQNLSTPVAIKEYYPSGVLQRHTQWGNETFLATGESPDVLEKHKTRFLQEARSLAMFSDIPEIVKVKAFFSANRTAYIVMEYVEGITLKEHLKRLGRPMQEEEALEIMEPLIRGLMHVHKHNLIHRDISPDNIMLPVSGGVKLIDFGTVRYVDGEGVSKSTEAVLKPGFAPMEQYNSCGNLGTWSDVYALCATFHYLLTGKIPSDVHDRLEDGEELKLLRSRTNISSHLIDVLEKGMRVRIAERIQNLDDLYHQLYSVSSERQVTVEKRPKLKFRKMLIPLIAFLICCALFLFNNEVKDESNPKIETVPQVTAGIPMDTPMTLPETEDVPADPGNWRDNRIMADPSYIYEDVNGESSVFGSSYQRNQILSITVLASVTNAPEDSWDISAEKDGSVLAWVIPRGGNHSLYDLYIAGYGGIWATEDTCYTLFNGYINAESISFNSSFHTDGATTMNNMFYACRSLRTLDLTGFVTSSVTDMSGMFWKCGSLQFLDLTGFDTRNVTDMAAMFSDCTALRSVDLHSFETSNVTLLTAMFYLCESMKEISLTNFDTANVTSTAKMFYGCTNLISVDVSTWDTSNVREMNGMFKNCPNLTDMRLGQWETDSATNMKDFRDNWWEQFN